MTVAELIAKLQEHAPDMLVAIEDADTSWGLNVTTVDRHYYYDKLTVFISGDYGSVISK